MHSHHLSNFLSWLVIKNKSGSVSFRYKYLTKPILANIRLLLAYNLINGYIIHSTSAILNNQEVTVYLKYVDGVPVMRGIKFFSRPGCYRYLTVKKIKKINKRDTVHNFHVVSTSTGVCTAAECLRKGLGGLLLYHVSV